MPLGAKEGRYARDGNRWKLTDANAKPANDRRVPPQVPRLLGVAHDTREADRSEAGRACAGPACNGSSDGRVPDEARLLPVTVRFTRPEINRLRAEADKYSVSLSTLVRDRLGVQPAPGVQAAIRPRGPRQCA